MSKIEKIIEIQPKVFLQIKSDQKTVWINDERGCCIGRFSKFGIDVHKTGEEQMRTGNPCLCCSHKNNGESTNLKDWIHFQEQMLKHHNVIISNKHKPKYLNTSNRKINM